MCLLVRFSVCPPVAGLWPGAWRLVAAAVFLVASVPAPAFFAMSVFVCFCLLGRFVLSVLLVVLFACLSVVLLVFFACRPLFSCSCICLSVCLFVCLFVLYI